jgi:hypothetical protein
VGKKGIVDGLDIRMGIRFGMKMKEEIREKIGNEDAPAWGALIEEKKKVKEKGNGSNWGG